MFRRCVFLLAMVGYIASQLALVPHAHSGMNADHRQHDATPHFHVGCDHHHHHHHHDHTRESDGHQHEQLPQESQKAIGLYVENDHDSSAVFIADNANSARKEVFESLTHALLAFLSSPAVVEGKPPTVDVPSAEAHPPDKVLDDSSLYLTLRTLRI